MKKIVILSQLTFSLFFIFSSCTRDKNSECGDTSDQTKNIPQGDLSMLIYKGSEKLVFVDSSTRDTHTFVGQGYYTDYGIAYKQDDCGIKYNLQRRSLTFKSATDSKFITANMLFYAIEDIPSLEINFNNTIFNTASVTLAGTNYNYDSLIIQGKTYHNIKYFRNGYNPQSSDVYGCFYNLTEGILKMQTSDGHVWELVRIE